MKIILLRLDNADCIVFNSLQELKKDLGLTSPKYDSFNILKNHERFKEKYMFFSYEKDLLRYI